MDSKGHLGWSSGHDLTINMKGIASNAMSSVIVDIHICFCSDMDHHQWSQAVTLNLVGSLASPVLVKPLDKDLHGKSFILAEAFYCGQICVVFQRWSFSGRRSMWRGLKACIAWQRQWGWPTIPHARIWWPCQHMTISLLLCCRHWRKMSNGSLRGGMYGAGRSRLCYLVFVFFRVIVFIFV